MDVAPPPLRKCDDECALPGDDVQTPQRSRDGVALDGVSPSTEAASPYSPSPAEEGRRSRSRSAEEPADNVGKVPGAVIPPSADDLARIQALLASGDVAAAEAALKKLRKRQHEPKHGGSGAEKKHGEKHSSGKHATASDIYAVVAGEETKARHSIEKELKRSTAELSKALKDAEHLVVDAIRVRSSAEKKAERERGKIEKERREVDRSEADGRRDITKDEKQLREGVERRAKDALRALARASAAAATVSATKSSSTVVGTTKQQTQPPAAGPTKSLAAFGFTLEKKKPLQDDASTQGRLFGAFVQDRRVVPRRLQFWNLANRVEDGQGGHSETAPSAKPTVTSFAATHAHSAFYTTHITPEGFNREVVYCSFHAVGFDPAQARPAYFGTCNPVTNTTEQLALARFSVGCEMPQLSTINYDYDSGDDWDHMESDEDVNDSSEDSCRDEDTDSNDSFINDSDCGDSDDEQVTHALNARNRRIARLRGKDRLVPTFSGPFVSCSAECHPYASFDVLEFADGEGGAAAWSLAMNEELARCSLLAAPLTETCSASTAGATVQARSRGRLMGPEEIHDLVTLVEKNAKLSCHAIVDILSKRPSFVGISGGELRRGITRYFDRHRGSLRLRDAPWAADDARLFEPKQPRREKKPPVGTSTGSADPDASATIRPVAPRGGVCWPQDGSNETVGIHVSAATLEEALAAFAETAALRENKRQRDTDDADDESCAAEVATNDNSNVV